MSEEWPDENWEIVDARVHDELSKLARRAYDLAGHVADEDVTYRLAELADEYTQRVLQLRHSSTKGPEP